MTSVSWHETVAQGGDWPNVPQGPDVEEQAQPASAAGLPQAIPTKRVSSASLLISAGLLLFAAASENQPRPTSEEPSLIRPQLVVSTVCVPLAATVGVFGWARLTRMWRRPEATTVPDEAAILQFVAASALGWGFVRTQAGLISCLGGLEHPREMGPQVASALAGQLYGTAFALVCICLAARSARRNQRPGQIARLLRRSSVAGGLTIVAGALTTVIAFCILRLSLAPAL